MKLQCIVLIITAVIVYNTLYDGKLIDMLKIKEIYPCWCIFSHRVRYFLHFKKKTTT